MAGTDITNVLVSDTTTPPGTGPTNNLVNGPQTANLVNGPQTALLIQQPFLNDIKTAITDAEKVEAGGGTALPPPNNFLSVDLTNGTAGSTPGDKFGGTTPGINAQFIKIPTSDNWLVDALTPGVFIGTYTGNDVLIANGGRNILDATSGKDVFFGGSGQDTFLADIRGGASTETINNFLSGDDLAVVGLTPGDFTLLASDSPKDCRLMRYRKRVARQWIASFCRGIPLPMSTVRRPNLRWERVRRRMV